MAVPYSIKMPDMSRNKALAGQTIRSNGMNVTYDDRGYAVKASKVNRTTSGSAGSAGTRTTSGATGGMASYGGGYPSAYDALMAANEAAVQKAIGQLTAQKTATNESYDDYARQAYRDKMSAERDIDQYLGARGVTGGAAESTILGLNTSYADELRKIEQSRRETVSALDRAISETRLTGDFYNAQTMAQAAIEAAKEQASLYAQEMQERRAAQTAQEQYERTETKERQSWARTIAGQMLAAGRMPDDETLAAAGITRAQAELLLAQTEEPNVYKPTFTVAQVQSELERARRYGTPLSANVLRDYEYYYGEPYGASAGGTASTGGTKSVSYNNGGYSTDAPLNSNAGIPKSLIEEINRDAEGGMSPQNLYNVILGWVNSGKITKAQGDWLAESFGY